MTTRSLRFVLHLSTRMFLRVSWKDIRSTRVFSGNNTTRCALIVCLALVLASVCLGSSLCVVGWCVGGGWFSLTEWAGKKGLRNFSDFFGVCDVAARGRSTAWPLSILPCIPEIAREMIQNV